LPFWIRLILRSTALHSPMLCSYESAKAASCPGSVVPVPPPSSD